MKKPQEKLENILKQIKTKTQHTNIYNYTVQRRKFIAVNTYIIKEERSQVKKSNITP